MSDGDSTLQRLLQAAKRPLQQVLLRLLRDVHRRIDELDLRLNNRLVTVERRALDLRRYGLEEIAEYLGYAQLDGDYCEFGVAGGHTFVNAYALMAHSWPEMRFHAFDSFEGLPPLQGPDAQDSYASGFFRGQFACSLDAFVQRLCSLKISESRYATYQGWFDQTLAEGQPSAAIGTVAVAWIDCDLYESTVPVLNFLTHRLRPGSVVVFDDWGCYRNQPDKGEQRACREWLDANPRLRLDPLFSYGWTGRVFTVSHAPIDRHPSSTS